jgi:hypothetical protein
MDLFGLNEGKCTETTGLQVTPEVGGAVRQADSRLPFVHTSMCDQRLTLPGRQMLGASCTCPRRQSVPPRVPLPLPQPVQSSAILAGSHCGCPSRLLLNDGCTVSKLVALYRWIWCPHSGGYEYRLLGCDAVWFCRRTLSLPSSGSKNNPSKKSARGRPQRGGLLSNDMALQLRRWWSL